MEFLLVIVFWWNYAQLISLFITLWFQDWKYLKTCFTIEVYRHMGISKSVFKKTSKTFWLIKHGTSTKKLFFATLLRYFVMFDSSFVSFVNFITLSQSSWFFFDNPFKIPCPSQRIGFSKIKLDDLLRSRHDKISS